MVPGVSRARRALSRVFAGDTMKFSSFAAILLAPSLLLAAEPASSFEYRLLATTKTSSMEKEMNQLAEAGYEFRAVMGGETAFGGKEVVVAMRRSPAGARKVYKLLAANKTSTLEKEMQSAGQEGFEYKGQTVFESAFGGREVAVIMELDTAGERKPQVYKLLATSKTSTMQKEATEAGAFGFDMLGLTVAKTAFGGSEVVCILRQNSD